MAGNILEEVFIAVGLDTKQVDKGMNNLTSTMKSGFKNIMSSVVAPALSMIGAFSAGDFVAQLGQEAMSVQKYAQLLGMTTETMSAWTGVAERFGVEADDLVDVLTDVNDKVTDVVNNDAGPFKELVDRGLIQSFKNADGTLKTTEQIIFELSDAVKSLGGQEGAGLLKRLGFNDPKMLTMLMQGGDALKGLVAQMKERGTYTDEDAEHAREFTIALKDMSRAIKMLLLPAFRLISPVLAATAKGFSFVTNHAVALAPALAAVATVMIARLIPAAIKTAKELRAAFSIRQFGILAALIAVGLVLEDFYTWLNGGKAALAGFYESLFDGVAGARAFLSELQKFAQVAGVVAGVSAGFWGIAKVITVVQGLVSTFGVATVASLGGIGIALAALVAAAYFLYQNWQQIMTGIVEWCTTTGEAVDDAFQTMSDTCLAIWNGLTGGMKSAWDSVTSEIASWINWFTDVFKGIMDGINRVSDFVGNFSFSGLSIGAAGDGGVTNANTTYITQENNVTMNGDVPQEQVDGFVGSANDGISGAVNSMNGM